ncbi:helix-turn-helix domain-containing protein, partial [Microcystis sp. M074S1]|uniref:helix-turn-helix domain-containing protein n=1 Tax=Microcystis sp. M074S1 TaxID=2771126 RepID=UPI00258C6379
MEKAYSFRFYPTPKQESLLRRTLGCVRLVYNKALQERTQAWYERQERVGFFHVSHSNTYFVNALRFNSKANLKRRGLRQ